MLETWKDVCANDVRESVEKKKWNGMAGCIHKETMRDDSALGTRHLHRIEEYKKNTARHRTMFAIQVTSVAHGCKRQCINERRRTWNFHAFELDFEPKHKRCDNFCQRGLLKN